MWKKIVMLRQFQQLKHFLKKFQVDQILLQVRHRGALSRFARYMVCGVHNNTVLPLKSVSLKYLEALGRDEFLKDRPGIICITAHGVTSSHCNFARFYKLSRLGPSH